MNTSFPLVSICIPTFNGEEFLREALESILAQTYPSIEVIVSDDDSKDKTLQIVNEYQKKTLISFSIFNHERYGIAGNWNFSVSKARGKYIKFLFQDDFMLPTCISRMVELAEVDENIGLVFSAREFFLDESSLNDTGCIQIYRYGQDVHKTWTKLNQVQHGHELLADPKLLESPLNKIGEPSNVLIRKSIFEIVGWFDHELVQMLDVDMWLRIMCQYKIGFLDEKLVHFRVHRQQASRKNMGLKNAVDNQLFQSKMLYSPQYSISDQAVQEKFRKGVSKLMELQLGQLIGSIETMGEQLRSTQEALKHNRIELEQMESQLCQAEKAIEHQLGLQTTLVHSNEKYFIQYKLLVKSAWKAYVDGNLGEMVQLLERSTEFTSALPTEIVLDWIENYNFLALESKFHFDTYTFIQSSEWQKIVNNLLFTRKL